MSTVRKITILLILLLFAACSVQRTTIQQHDHWSPVHKIDKR